MDRIANNESLLVYAILNILKKDISQVAKLYLVVIMSVDKAIRGRMARYTNYSDMVKAESEFDQALNRKFLEMQPVFLNAMTMLLLSGKVEIEDDRLELTSDGAYMADDIQTIEGVVVGEVKSAVASMCNFCKDKDENSLYTDLKIVL